jgi:O-methyltransferase
MGFILNLKNDLKEKYISALIRRNTMLTPARIESLKNLAHRIDEEGIPGDFIECGVYKGGSAALVMRVATRSRFQRNAWLFDVFQGMPPATSLDGPDAVNWVGNLRSSPEKVSRLLRRVGVDMTRVHIVPGLFQETFPTVRLQQIAFLNIDADWYESVKLCLEKFYDVVAPGGFVSFDDYGAWPGCRLAVDEFFERRRLPYKLVPVDPEACWFQKR